MMAPLSFRFLVVAKEKLKLRSIDQTINQTRDYLLLQQKDREKVLCQASYQALNAVAKNLRLNLYN